MSSLLRHVKGKNKVAKKEPSESQRATLLANQELLTTSFTLDEHEDMLKELWARLHRAQSLDGTDDPAATYKRVNDAWTLFGFQRDDPVSDIRGGGVLSVQLLLYFLREHGKTASAMMLTQQASIATREDIAATGISKAYPFAACGINVTRVVAQAFGLVGAAGNKADFSKEKRSYWTLADEFSEVFCVVFRLTDRVWKDMDADYMMFKQVPPSYSGGARLNCRWIASAFLTCCHTNLRRHVAFLCEGAGRGEEALE